MKPFTHLIIAGFFASSMALAQGPHMGPMPPLVADLNLTESQQKQLKDHHDQNAEAFIDLRAGMQKAELRLRQALESQPIDESKLASAREEILKFQAQQIDFRIAHMRYFLSVLTPEQRTQFVNSMDKMPPHGKPDFKKDRKDRKDRKHPKDSDKSIQKK